ncbi:MAG: SLC13 family permease [Polyangiaceae bacterium]
MITSVFAIVCLLLGEIMGLIHRDPVKFLGHTVDLPVYIPGIDWGVIAIILGSSIFVDVTSQSGLFTWIAIKLTKMSRGEPRRLLILYGAMTVLFSAVLNNVTAMIIVGSLTAVSLSKLERREYLLGFLLIEGLLTNVGGLLTLISSVPNIIVGQAAGISFLTFFVRAAPYVLLATIVTIWLGARLFQIKPLANDKERKEALAMVSAFDENDGVASKGFFWFGTAMLVLFILTIATASALPYIRDLGMGFVAMFFAVVMLIRVKSEADKIYKAVDWDLIAFFAGLFVTINVMEHAMVLDMIGGALKPVLGLGTRAGSALMVVLSGLFSSVTDNIPLSAMLAKIMRNSPAVVPDPAVGNPSSPFWWSVIFGANLGGNLTPIGSASTLVAVTIMHKHKLRVSFLGFVKKAAPYALIQLVLAVVYILLFMR